MQKDARLIVSIALCAIAAIVALTDSDRAASEAFVVTEPPAVLPEPPSPIVEPEPQPEPTPEPQVAEIVCTFRCDACKRAPTLTYHEGDALPICANCKQCGRSMPRTDPKLSEVERAKLPRPRTAMTRRRAAGANCST